MRYASRRGASTFDISRQASSGRVKVTAATRRGPVRVTGQVGTDLTVRGSPGAVEFRSDSGPGCSRNSRRQITPEAWTSQAPSGLSPCQSTVHLAIWRQDRATASSRALPRTCHARAPEVTGSMIAMRPKALTSMTKPAFAGCLPGLCARRSAALCATLLLLTSP